MSPIDDVKAPRWGVPPPALALDEDEVHVWRTRAPVGKKELRHILGLLPRAERHRVERSSRPNELAARLYVTRTLLGRYDGRDFAKVRLGPRRALRARHAPHFDVAMAGRLALFAISFSHRLAVAVEAVPSGDELERQLRELDSRLARQVEFLSPEARAQAVAGYRVERLAIERLGAPDAGAAQVERLKVGGSHVAALAAEGWGWSPSFWEEGRLQTSDPRANLDREPADDLHLGEAATTHRRR